MPTRRRFSLHLLTAPHPRACFGKTATASTPRTFTVVALPGPRRLRAVLPLSACRRLRASRTAVSSLKSRRTSTTLQSSPGLSVLCPRSSRILLEHWASQVYLKVVKQKATSAVRAKQTSLSTAQPRHRRPPRASNPPHTSRAISRLVFNLRTILILRAFQPTARL